MTVEWAFDRYSFGRPLASYQALKHRFADMKSWLEAAHAIADADGVGRGDRRSDRAPTRRCRGGVHRRVRHRTGPRLRPDPWRHRGDVRARSALLPPAHRGEPVRLREPGGAPPAPRRLARAARRRRSRATPSRHERRGSHGGGGVMSAHEIEPVEEFRARARAWIRETLPPSNLSDEIGQLRPRHTDDEDLAEITAARALQRTFFDAGFAGICFPREYGGQGLTPAHQTALQEELSGFAYPFRIQAPTFAPCAAVLLEFGTEEQKQRHLPAILQGRGTLDAAAVRAERWFRRRRCADDGRARRRRVGPQRVEGVDHGGVVLRLGPVPGADELGRSEASWSVGVHPAAPPGRVWRSSGSRCSTGSRTSARSS